MRLAAIVLALVAVTITSEVNAAPPERARNAAAGNKIPEPKIYFLHIKSDIKSRYAKTLVTSKVANPADKAQEVVYQMTIPESAFISNFTMLVDDQLMEGQVKERTEAKHEYHAAKESGQTAGHVATATVRDSNQVRISVNVGPLSKVTFNVTYEELLARRKARYELAINVNPGQVVPDMSIDVFIEENRNITLLQVPEFRSTNEIDFEERDEIFNLTQVTKISKQKLHLNFAPSESDQIRLSGNGKQGLGGRFVVRYDVDRKNQPASEVLTKDGYFVHFFTPPEEEPLPKHVVFVLDVSGSMYGTKMSQLKEAMNAILDELRPQDFFNLIEFSHPVTILNLDTPSNSTVIQLVESSSWYEQTTPSPEKAIRSVPDKVDAYPATPFYISIAKEAVEKMSANGGTNIHDSVKAAIEVTKKAVPNNDKEGKLPAPIIIFLTDGEATVGETSADQILKIIPEDQKESVPVFSLAFGDDADLKFLKRLSLRAGAFARKIYEAADAALQLRDFYRQVASPLLTNATFNYDQNKVEGKVLTKQKFGLVFSGSELVVAGKLNSGVEELSGTVFTSNRNFPLLPFPGERPEPVVRDTEDNFLERLWAFLSIKQSLDKYEAWKVDAAPAKEGEEKSAAQKAKEEALRLALQFSFVTPVTSLIVVKKDDTTAKPSTNQNDIKKIVIQNEEEDEATAYPSGASYSAIALQAQGGYSILKKRITPTRRPIRPSGHGYGGSSLLQRIPSPPRTTTLALPSGFIMQKESVAEEALDSDFDSDLVPANLPTTMTAPIETTTIEATIPISSIPWLVPSEGDNNSSDWQNFKLENSTEIYKVLSFSKSQNVTGEACGQTTTPGICRPFTACVLRSFSETTSAENFTKNFKCDISLEGEIFLGACCPVDNAGVTTTRLEAEVN
ncbi:inter-alpha-trypsin inhibitor heavy chain H4-like [Neocloeon triangulifer]|uniref:inter-alpha-trypsin inhibitor heavy chain H4-like n=1 Tax=Neocloeon triangulifer TaxID=2078957 RepID=UPI00286F8992|nr:inter-alpha-trypsin inhibitor heavy chain H4-like [Neocloeon triangulifer]